MLDRAGVGARIDGDAGVVRGEGHAQVRIDLTKPGRAVLRMERQLGRELPDVVADQQGRHECHLGGRHRLQVVRRGAVSVLDRVEPGLDGSLDRGRDRGVHRDPRAGLMRRGRGIGQGSL